MQKPQRIGGLLVLGSLSISASLLAQPEPASSDLARLQGTWSAADLIGTRVRASDGNEVGEIEDLVISADARVATVVVSVGGFLDVADKLVAVPYDDVRIWSDDKTLTIPLTADELEARPAYKEHPPAVGAAEPIVDPARAAPPDAATRRQAEADAARVFAGDDPRVAEGIAENTKAYEEDKEKKKDASPQQ
jgi:sporulation protein YlmC with PRC-barrel domain